jgi:DNA-binding NtrC family response regulator
MALVATTCMTPPGARHPRGRGYDAKACIGAGNFTEAKTVLSTQVPDLLITELRLGDFNGLHLVVRARSSQSAIATIVLTRFPDPVLEAEAKRLGAAYLVNPVKPAELLTVVSRELGMGLEPRHAPECSEPPNPMAALHQSGRSKHSRQPDHF